MRWIDGERPTATVVLGAEADRVERTAARLLVEEVRARTGVTLPVATERELGSEPGAPAGGLIVLGTPTTSRLVARAGVRAEADPRGEAIAVRFGRVEDRPAVFAVGAGPRGALYAAVELLERLEYAETGAGLPDLDVAHRPSFAWRSWSQSGTPLYDPAATAQLDLFKRNLAYVARHRGNVAQTGHWPDRLGPLVGYRHFPSLHDPAREAELDRFRSRVRELIELAGEHGLDYFISTSELSYPPELPDRHSEIVATDPPDSHRIYRHPDAGWSRAEGRRKRRICASHPTTRAWYRAKIRELFEELPAAAGLALSVSWGDTDIFYCACQTCSARTSADRVLDLIELSQAGMDDAAPGAAKRLLLKTYLGGWRDVLAEQIFGPLAGRLDPRVVVSNNSEWGDTYYTNAPHPLAGRFAPHNAEVVEHCIGGEYRGGLLFGMVCAFSQFMHDRIELHADHGVTGIAQRHLQWRNIFNEPDFQTFYALGWDCDASPELIWQRWAEASYGKTVGPQVVEILRDGTRAMAGSMYLNGVVLTSHHLFPESLERMRHLVADRGAKMTEGGLERIAPTPENLRRAIAEKDAAIALLGAILRRIERLRPGLPAAHHRALELSFGLMYELALVYRELAELFLRYLRWAATLSEVDRELQRRDIAPLVGRLRTATARLRERVPALWRPELFEALGTDRALWERPESFIWGTLDFENGFPFDCLERIADDLDRAVDVEAASLWGYFPTPATS
jgi:hypothetical protein